MEETLLNHPTAEPTKNDLLVKETNEVPGCALQKNYAFDEFEEKVTSTEESPARSNSNTATTKLPSEHTPSELPPKINKTSQMWSHTLTSLNLSHKDLQELPVCIAKLTQLLDLDVSHNCLQDLPIQLKCLRGLRFMNLSHNQFSQVPLCLCRSFPNLMVLNFSHNQLPHFTDPPVCLEVLVRLDISYNKLECAPDWLLSPNCNLQEVELGQNKFSKGLLLRSPIHKPGLYLSLKILKIKNAELRFEDLEFLNNCSHLCFLDLSNEVDNSPRNMFTNLRMDPFVAKDSFTTLKMNHCTISLLPTDFGVLRTLRVLSLTHNTLVWLPDSFCDLVNLEICDLGHNLLCMLPDNMSALTNLKELYVNDNNLSDVSKGLGGLPNLQVVDLYHNELNEWPVGWAGLRGFDVDMNFCTLPSGESLEKYCVLRTQVRELRGEQRLFGMRTQVETDSSEFSSVEHGEVGCLGRVVDEEDWERDESGEEMVGCANIDENWEEGIGKEMGECADVVGKEENWEESGRGEEDLYEQYRTPLPKKPVPSFMKYADNYCPARYHATSLLHYKPVLKTEIVDGQFDSD